MDKLSENSTSKPNIVNPVNDYLLMSAYLLGTLKLAIVHNTPLSVEDMKDVIMSAKQNFKKEMEVVNA